MPAARRIGVGDLEISPLAKQYVNQVLDANRLSYGLFSRRFEREWCRIHDQRFGVLVNSGTSALQIGLAALKERYRWKDGAKVIVPATTFVASYNVVLQNNLTPVLVDVDPKTFLISHEGWPKDAVAVMPVNLYGATVPSDIYQRAKDNGLRVITDSCETALTDCAGGDITAFSFYACHTVTTGVGGMATTNDATLAQLLRSLANHGRDGIYCDIDQELGQVEVINARFRFERPGYSYRLTEMEAALGCAALETWLDNANARRRNGNYLIEKLSGLPLRFPEADAVWMFLPIVCNSASVRDSLVQHLESAGIETRYFLPLIDQPYIKRLGEFPVASELVRRAFYVSTSNLLTEDDLKYMVDVFKDHFLLV